jgi:hypothetical protein
LELDRISAGAVLDVMRTVRSGIGQDLEAKGTIAGTLVYNPDAARAAARQAETPKAMHRASKGMANALTPRAAQGPLTGSLVVEGLQLSGDGLSTPVQAAKVVFEPAAPATGEHAALVASVGVPLGGAAPMAVAVRLRLSGYQISLRGPASVARAREVAKAARMPQASLLDSLAGDPISADLIAAGPWITAENIPVGETLPQSPAGGARVVQTNPSPADGISGTITLRNANWKADYLANAVMISQATLHLDGGDSRWDPVVFTYGPVKGSATVNLPVDCIGICTPRFTLDFGSLDAGALEAAILGAQEKGTLLSELIAGFSSKKSSAGSAWPRAEGTVKAETLLVGPLTLHDATAALNLTDAGVEITSIDAAVLGGQVHGTGAIHPPGGDRDKPGYMFDAAFKKLNPAAVGELAGAHWKGGELNADGKVELSGFTSEDLASSAHGALQLDWRRGSVAAEGEGGEVPAELAHFDRWTADAEIANGAIRLNDNAVRLGGRKTVVSGSLAFGDPATLTLTAPKAAKARQVTQAKR